MKKLLFLQFNEINFDVLKKYDVSRLKNFNQILKDIKVTSSEKKYELLEPWIQWVSAYTGKTAIEHGIFRLGDVVNKENNQIFEIIEKKGYSVGSILPMNCSNKLQNAKYFLPDPWTQTHSNQNFWIKMMSGVFAQAVNDNSKNQITLINYLKLFLIFLRFSKFKNFFTYLKLLIQAKSNKYKKAIFFDLLLHDVHLKLIKKYKTDFSSIFFNGCAHIQHHFFLNSKFVEKNKNNPEWYLKKELDPFFEIIQIYDEILGDYINLDYDIILATGLSQIPSVDPIFYYRLNDHTKFLKFFMIDFKNVFPRMTRDFLIEFEDESKKEQAKIILENIKTDKNHKIFNEIENRKNSLFVTLDYSNEIKKNDEIFYKNKKISFLECVNFVALKNGIHNEKGYFYCSKNINDKPLLNEPHVKNIFNVINGYFNA